MITRFLETQVLKSLQPGQVVGLFGPRRVGKTVLMEKIIQGLGDQKILSVAGDNLSAAENLSSQRLDVLEKFLLDFEYLFIDEAQKIPNIGINLKLIVDHIKNIKVFVTGSSSFDLRRQVGEPLVGRNRFFHLYPIAQLELKQSESWLQTQTSLETRLIFGSYPQVIEANTNNEKQKILESIRDGYLLKDILELDNLKNSLFIFNLLRAIAFQIGNDISYSELASNLDVNKKTVMRYLELLEKIYVVFPLYPFSRNLRKEYFKTPRYYFWDNGVRNAIISNFNPLNSRDDVGKLWENYCQIERLKKVHYTNLSSNRYFWRTYDKKEIDLIEEREGKLFAFEFKWKREQAKLPKLFMKTYKNSEFKLINQENYLDFIT